MKIVKGIAGILSGLGFLFTLGSIGTIDFVLECCAFPAGRAYRFY